jgi:hypothetical protein
MATYLPSTPIEIVKWVIKFIGKLKSFYQSTLSVTDAEITDLENKTTVLDNANKNVSDLQLQLENAVLAQKNAKADLTSDITAVVKRIRSRKELTDSIASDLSIVNATSSVDFNSLKPDIKITLVGNVPQYEYTKKGASGISVYCKRGGDTNFVFIDKDLKSPYVDERPNLQPGTPEIRSYKFRYFYDDKEVGNWSDEISVTVNN